MHKRFATASLFGLSISVLSGCVPWVNDAIHLAQDVKKTSDDYEREKHEERVEELDQEYEEFLKPQGRPETDDEESEQSIVIIKNETDADRLLR